MGLASVARFGVAGCEPWYLERQVETFYQMRMPLSGHRTPVKLNLGSLRQ